MLPFARQLEHLGYADLNAENLSTLQVNLGWRCNQACKHCHLKAGPQRPEQIQRYTIDAVIRVVERWTIPFVDLTGGAPGPIGNPCHPPLQPDDPVGTRPGTPGGILSRPPGGVGGIAASLPGRPGGPPPGGRRVSEEPGSLAPPQSRRLRRTGLRPPA